MLDAAYHDAVGEHVEGPLLPTRNAGGPPFPAKNPRAIGRARAHGALSFTSMWNCRRSSVKTIPAISIACSPCDRPGHVSLPKIGRGSSHKVRLPMCVWVLGGYSGSSAQPYLSMALASAHVSSFLLGRYNVKLGTLR